MPFTYSIAYGLIAGICSYIVINTVVWIIEKSTGGKIKPAEKEYKDAWTYKIEGGLLPPWLTRAAKGKRDFWRPDEDAEHNAESPTGITVEGKQPVDASGVPVYREGSSSDEDPKDVRTKL